jgi:hypothetical protein
MPLVFFFSPLVIPFSYQQALTLLSFSSNQVLAVAFLDPQKEGARSV